MRWGPGCLARIATPVRKMPHRLYLGFKVDVETDD
jgi:hypothetical protein